MIQSSLLAFTGGKLDRCANQRGDAGWLEGLKRKSDTMVMKMHGDRLPLNDSAYKPASRWDDVDSIFLGLDETGVAWFAYAGEVPEPAIDLRSLAATTNLPEGQLSLLAQARSLLHWHEKHGFCAHCGIKTEMADGGYRRHCSACKTDHFPRTDPVVIIAVRSGSRLLLGRQASWPQGMYSTLAGFMEPGETIEEAARREVFEEAGIRVGEINFIANQPWPFPASLMLGLTGDALTDAIVIDPKELETARWFESSEIHMMLKGIHPEGLKLPPPLAIAHHLILECLQSS